MCNIIGLHPDGMLDRDQRTTKVFTIPCGGDDDDDDGTNCLMSSGYIGRTNVCRRASYQRGCFNCTSTNNICDNTSNHRIQQLINCRKNSFKFNANIKPSE